MKSRTRLLVAAALLLGMSSLAYWRWPTTHGSGAAGGSTPPAVQGTGGDVGERRRADRTTVTALGRLAPRGEVVNVGAPDGDRLARLLVTEGQHVRAAEPLAYLDTFAERDREKHLIAARLAEAKARLVTETAHGQALIDEATARLRQIENLPALEIQVQESRVNIIEAELETAGRDLERLQTLIRGGLVAQQELERQALVVQRSQLDLRGARILHEKLRQAFALDRSLAEEQLKTARAALAKAQSAIELDSLREALSQAEARLERSVIRAPVTGEILKILSRAGETTGPRPILQMGDTAKMYAVAEVYETDVGLIRPRQRATITSLALPHAISGTVESVGRIVAKNAIVDVDPAAAADRRVVEVKILLDDSKAAAPLVSLQIEVRIDVRDR